MTVRNFPISMGNTEATTVGTKFKFENNFMILIFSGIFLTALVTMSGCVSVKLGEVSMQKSQEAQWEDPSKPFQETKSVHLDHKWANTKNGNIISFLSDCGNPTDPSLENIFKGITSEIEEVQVISSGKVDYNSRQALHSIVEGQVDGVASRFELMIFKKNDCTYILTYAAAAKAFAENQREFEKFVKGFLVP